MPSINDLPQLREIPPGTFEALANLVNLSSAELSDHLDITIAMLLAYEGADISAETNGISELLLRAKQKIEAHDETNALPQRSGTHRETY